VDGGQRKGQVTRGTFIGERKSIKKKGRRPNRPAKSQGKSRGLGVHAGGLTKKEALGEIALTEMGGVKMAKSKFLNYPKKPFRRGP